MALTVDEEAPVKFEKVPAGQGVGELLPGGQKAPDGQREHVLEPELLAVANRPAAHDEGSTGAAVEGGTGAAGAGEGLGGEGEGLGDEGEAHTKAQPWGHQTMGHPLVSRP